MRPAPERVDADALIAAIRVHADRVHDAVRRQGVPPDTAVQVVEQSALELVRSAAQRPAPVRELVGRWFALADAAGQRAGTDDAYLPTGTGPLAGDDEQRLLARGLERQPPAARAALLLRDAYDLPAETVGAALGVGPDEALRRVGRARLALLPDVLPSPAPAVSGHAVDEAALARLVDGGAPSARDATVARHLRSCEACREVVAAQQDVRRLLAGLSVAALPDPAREGLLERVAVQVRRVLPTAPVAGEESWEEDAEPRRLLSPLAVALSLLTAGAVGVALGVVTSGDGPVRVAQVGAVPLVTAPPLPPLDPPGTPSKRPLPATTVFTIAPVTPSPTPAPSRSPSPTATSSPSPTATPSTPPPAGPAEVAVAPDAGPAGAPVTVSGRGWPAAAQLTITYRDADGRATGSRATATADDDGAFSARLATLDPQTPQGRHVVLVTDGTTSVRATYDAS